MSQIRILIVDDHPLFRQGLADVLETNPQFEVIGQAADGTSAIRQTYELEPDVILMDINLPGSNGLEVTRKIKASSAPARIVTITGYDDPHQVLHALQAGASAYCPKDIMPDELINIIDMVYRGFYVVDGQKMTHDEVLLWLDQRLGAEGFTSISDSPRSPLSAREMEILKYVTQGYSNKQIAFELGISHQTVKNHMTAILRKLHVDDRTQAAVYALRSGWVRLDGR
jgi:DNA-binding NarL/FixJ family response regulator